MLKFYHQVEIFSDQFNVEYLEIIRDKFESLVFGFIRNFEKNKCVATHFNMTWVRKNHKLRKKVKQRC